MHIAAVLVLRHPLSFCGCVYCRVTVKESCPPESFAINTCPWLLEFAEIMQKLQLKTLGKLQIQKPGKSVVLNANI